MLPCRRFVSRRSFASIVKSPGSNPLDVWRKECVARNLCDMEGGRLPGTHWVFCIATSHDHKKPPSLRTVGIERVSPHGIDFVMKRSHPAGDRLASQDSAIAFLHMQGQYLPGIKAEQWRGEGFCQELALAEILDLIPHFTITSMVGSRRSKEEVTNLDELKNDVSEDRLAMLSKSHMTEVMQKTRIELENGDISMEELEASIRAFRLRPDRLECMIGGPESVMWDRWEWLRDTKNDGPRGSIEWNEPKHLIPH